MFRDLYCSVCYTNSLFLRRYCFIVALRLCKGVEVQFAAVFYNLYQNLYLRFYISRFIVKRSWASGLLWFYTQFVVIL